jgi:hypothetical protein
MAKTTQRKIALSTPPTSSLNIGGITIQQDENGRFSLNDLHQAAGGEERHKPARFVRSTVFKDLAEALRAEFPASEADGCSKNDQGPDMALGNPATEPVQVIHGGPNRGTYVARELVYAYAMWISPAFNLRVIRTFDALMMGRIQAVRDDARLAIEARDAQLFLKTDTWEQEVMHRDEGFKLLRQIKAEPDVHLRRHHHNALASLYRRLGDEVPPFEEMTPLQLPNGPSREELEEKVEELENLRDILLEALLVLHRSAEMHLINADDLAPSDQARKAVKLALAQKGGSR